MVLPVGTDQYAKRTPVATLGLIVLCVLASIATLLVDRSSGDRGVAELLAQCGLSRANFRLWQPLSYQFLHDPGSLLHLAGNMLFLWIFGSAVESRLGAVGFVAFYLVGGAVAGLVQMAFASGGVVIGASGAVSAVTGAFIVLFPRARVVVFLLFSLVPIPALLLVSIYLALDFLGVLGLRGGGVAYLAHIGGLVFGVSVAAVLLATGVIRRTDMDMVFLLRQWRRRSEMRRVVRSSGAASPWSGSPPPALQAAPRVDAPVVEPRVPNMRLAERLVTEATAAYARGDFLGAAATYQRALDAAPAARDADQTRLMLAVIYGRKLGEPARASEQLRAIGPGLPAPLRELEAALRAEVNA